MRQNDRRASTDSGWRIAMPRAQRFRRVASWRPLQSASAIVSRRLLTLACRRGWRLERYASIDFHPDRKEKARVDAGFGRILLVPKGGLEPPRLSALPPQGSASTNS